MDIVLSEESVNAEPDRTAARAVAFSASACASKFRPQEQAVKEDHESRKATRWARQNEWKNMGKNTNSKQIILNHNEIICIWWWNDGAETRLHYMLNDFATHQDFSFLRLSETLYNPMHLPAQCCLPMHCRRRYQQREAQVDAEKGAAHVNPSRSSNWKWGKDSEGMKEALAMGGIGLASWDLYAVISSTSNPQNWVHDATSIKTLGMIRYFSKADRFSWHHEPWQPPSPRCYKRALQTTNCR